MTTASPTHQFVNEHELEFDDIAVELHDVAPALDRQTLQSLMMTMKFMGDEVYVTVNNSMVKLSAADRANLTELLKEMPKVLSHTVSSQMNEGGDHRNVLDKNSGNKYFCPPWPMPNWLLRSSSTCSPPTQAGFTGCEQVMRSLLTGQMTFTTAMNNLRSDIASGFGLSDILQNGRNIITVPSGTDAEMIPLLVALQRATKLFGNAGRVLSLIVGAGEVGTGSAAASTAKRISDSAPHNKSSMKLNDPIPGFPADRIDLIELFPRDSEGRLLLDCSEQVEKTVDEAFAKNPKQVILLHGVEGSKTGLRIPGHAALKRMAAKYGRERLVTVIDACQCRSTADELRDYLEQDCSILITGSKFYHGAGFCGAVLMPNSQIVELQETKNSNVVIPQGFHDYLCADDTSIPEFRSQLFSDRQNLGLLLRWTCATVELKNFGSQCAAGSAAVGQWVEAVSHIIRTEFSENFSLLADTEPLDHVALDMNGRIGNCNSVVGIYCRGSPQQPIMDADQLKMVHTLMSKSCAAEVLPSNASEVDRRICDQVCMIGQPVKLGSRGVLRMAMSAPLACRIAQDGIEPVSLEDRIILSKLALLTRYVANLHK